MDITQLKKTTMGRVCRQGSGTQGLESRAARLSTPGDQAPLSHKLGTARCHIASPSYRVATMLGQRGRRARGQRTSPMALRRSTGGCKAEGDPSLSWLSSGNTGCIQLSGTQQGSQARRPGSASPSRTPFPGLT